MIFEVENALHFLTSKKGEKYTCDVCGLVVSVEEKCECDECVIICCEKPMKKTE